METELTREIKRRLRTFRPAMHSDKRTIRWAEEVQTISGYVDVIRFEDYVAADNSYCARIAPSFLDRQSIIYRPETPRTCKSEGCDYPNNRCHGCVYRRTVYELGILVTCFEVKVSLSDFRSPNGHNFHGHHNYYAAPVQLCGKIVGDIPEGTGLIAYYPDSGRMAVKRECIFQEVDSTMLEQMLYNALKKWVDGTQETSKI